MAEVYKFLKEVPSDIMNDGIKFSKHGYYTRRYNLFVTDMSKTDRDGWKTIPYRPNQIWNLLNRERKKLVGLDSFQSKVMQ